MGQKVNPHGLRVGVIKDWQTQWFAGKKDFGKYLHEDHVLRTFIKEKYFNCAISSFTIQRLTGSKIVLNILTGRPGMMIGQKGAGIEEMKKQLAKLVPDKTISINIMEVKRQDMNGYNETDFVLLKPKLAYAVGRADKNSKIKDFFNVLSKAMDEVVKSTNPETSFKNFIKIFEAIVAYHKAAEEQK